MSSTDERRLREGWLRVPFCALLTPGEAVTRLRDAGLSGDVVLAPLSPDDAWVDGPPGRVTGTEPYAPQVVPPDSRVVVYVNPGPVAPLTPEDRHVGELRRAEHERMLAIRTSWAVEAAEDGPPAGIVVPRPAAARLLTDELLDALEARLAAAGASVALAPGLSDDAIDELACPAGLDLPEEARRWWRWQDGVLADALPRAAIAERTPRPLAEVIALWEETRGETLQVWEVDGLLPAVDELPHVFFESLGPRDAPVPVYVQHDVEAPELAFASIGELVAVLIELLDAGVWSVGADGVWHRHDERVPAPLRDLAVW